MARRGDPDPPLLPVVSQRLARLLAEAGPGAVEPTGRRPDLDAAEDEDRVAAPASPSLPLPRSDPAELLEVDEVAMPRRFSRRHAGVVVVLLVAGLLWAGWAVLRARPVALATPVTVSAAAPGPSVTPGPAPSPPPVTPPDSGAPSPSGPAPPTGSAPRTGSAPPTGAAPTTGGGSAGPDPAQVVVHVLGAVADPGLVTLPGPARVQDAVQAAGGFRRDADPDDLNLAQLLADGQQIVIGTRKRPAGEVRGSAGASSGSAPGAGGQAPPGARAGDGAGGVLNLNEATVSELDELPGVGPVTAAKIIAWREEHTRFSSVAELQEVDGIGPKTYAEIAPHVGV